MAPETELAGPRKLGLQARILRWIGRFSADFWTFFAAALLFDLGFGLFFFLFNLYLTQLHFNERAIGQIMASLTLGSVIGTIPVTVLVRRYGLKKLLLVSLVAVPLICAARVFVLTPVAQIGLAFLTGIGLCCWPICFSPAVARMTNDANRASAFSLVFATGIGTACLAGLAGGYLPQFFQMLSRGGSPIMGTRSVLFCACGIAMLGSWPILRIKADTPAVRSVWRVRILHPFLLRFLPPVILWNVVAGSFSSFGAVYLMNCLGLHLDRIGTVFSISQLVQFTAVLCTPILFRRLGTIRGIAMAQVTTAAFLLLICSTRNASLAVIYFLAFNGAQWMCSPGIYRYLMDHIPEVERSTASAVQNLSSGLCQSSAASITGICIVRFGYPAVIAGNAGFALAAAILFLALPHWSARSTAIEHSANGAAELSA